MLDCLWCLFGSVWLACLFQIGLLKNLCLLFLIVCLICLFRVWLFLIRNWFGYLVLAMVTVWLRFGCLIVLFYLILFYVCVVVCYLLLACGCFAWFSYCSGLRWFLRAVYVWFTAVLLLNLFVWLLCCFVGFEGGCLLGRMCWYVCWVLLRTWLLVCLIVLVCLDVGVWCLNCWLGCS